MAVATAVIDDPRYSSSYSGFNPSIPYLQSFNGNIEQIDSEQLFRVSGYPYEIYQGQDAMLGEYFVYEHSGKISNIKYSNSGETAVFVYADN